MSRRATLFVLVFLFNGIQKGTVEYIVPGLDRIFRYVVFAGDAVILLLAVMAVLRTRSFAGTRAWLLLLVSSFFTLAVNLELTGVATHLAGLREPLFLLSSLVLCYDLLTTEGEERFESNFSRALLAFVVLQIPVTIYQFLRYGASDYVGGTFGWGGSGIISLLAFTGAFYALARGAHRDGEEGFSVPRIAWASLLLIPIAVNETKVSFLLLGVYALLLVDLRRVGQVLVVAGFGVTLFVLLVTFYGENVQDSSRLLDTDFLERYLFYDRRESVDMPRFQKLTLTTERMAGYPLSLLVGTGYGTFSGGNILDASATRDTYSFLSGSRMFLNTIFVQGGALAVLAFVVAFAGILWRASLPRPLRRLRVFLIVLVAGVWIYSDAFLNRAFGMALGFVMSWLAFHAAHPKDEAEVSAEDTDGIAAETA